MQLGEARAAAHLPAARTVGRQRILVGDCLLHLRAMPPGSVDVCVTSPPYNIGIAYGRHHDRMPQDAYLAWMAEVGAELARVLRDDGSLFLNVGGTGAQPWLAHDVARAVAGTAWTLQNHIVWVKSLSIGADTVGHFKPIQSRRFLNNNHEAVFHFTRTGNLPIDRLAVGVPFKDKSNIGRWGHARDKRCGGNVWFMPYETVKSKAQKFGHPAGFPVALPLRCIQLHGKPGAAVLDPFGGAGTTLVAAERLRCPGTAIELDPAYADAAEARLRTEAERAPSPP